MRDILKYGVDNMKTKIINGLMTLIEKEQNFNEEKLEIIKYGLEGVYLTISKLIIICILAYILNLFYEIIVFLILYSIIRMTSFGLHAKKSWVCLLSSTIIFVFVPFISLHIMIPIYLKVIIGIILIGLIYKNAPADTHKRPIVNYKRRMIYKYCSTFIAIIYVYCAVLIDNNFFSNSFIFALLVQVVIISPLVYKIFKSPYNNYLAYLANNNI